jgi:hypothetical protein
MIRVLSAYSREPDDPERAVEDILGQLDLKNRLLKNSAALVFCHVDFFDLGVAAALSRRLPCEAVGCSSLCFAVPGAADEILLSVMVLTSDEAEFAAGVSEPLGRDTGERVEALYRKTAALLSSPLRLIFALEPMLTDLNDDTITAALDRAGGGVPVFGTCAMDIDTKLRNPKTFYGGASYTDRLALLLISGPLSPRFFSALYPHNGMFAQAATITAAWNNRIISINNMPAVFYLEKTGLIHQGVSEALFVIPFLVDYGDGSGSQTVVVSSVDREGGLVCTRTIRAGGTLNIGSTTADYVLETARSLVRTIIKEDQRSALFMFSCFSRNVALGDPLEESRVIQEELAGFPVPYTFCYSGGEICPQYTGPERTVNRFHQYALVACLL